MANYLTRLTERTLGTTPVVQPLIGAVFAPEPTNHWPGSGQGREAPTERPDKCPQKKPDINSTPGSETPAHTPSPEETPLAGRSEDAPGNVAPTTAKRHQRTPDARSDPRRPLESRPSERGIAFRQEDQQSLSPDASEFPRRTPGSQPESFRLSESDPPERGAISGKEDRWDPAQDTTRHSRTPPETNHRAEPGSTPPNALSTPQDASEQTVFPPPRPSQDMRASLEEDTTGYEAARDLSASPDTPPVTPRVVHPRLDGYPERDLHGPHVAALEPPTIRVTISSIEVRAVSPPSPPAQRRAPARPGPALSLDDYLKQRAGGRR
jgi:hypothetical protein